MLGIQSWYTALAVPTIVVGGFVATRKRLAYQWREELMDPECTAYPSVTDADMEFLRRVAPESAVLAAEAVASPLDWKKERAQRTPAVDTATEGAYGVTLTAKENIGLCVRSNTLPPETRNVLLNEVQRWSQTFGNTLDPRKITAVKRSAQLATAKEAEERCDTDARMPFSSSGSLSKWLSFDFLAHTRVIADHAEDIQMMKAPWRTGDCIRLAEMPASLRYLVERARQTFEGIGRLRHVYIEYSPTGQFYRVPKPPKMYDGHDYVVIPLRRDQSDVVVTMSPVLRSRVSDLREVMRHSWTNRDVDVLLPSGCMLRVYGSARYEWGWGVRPGPPWFGSRLNPLSRASAARLDGGSGAGLWSWLKRALGPHLGMQRPSSTLSVPSLDAPTDAALIVLHYEGPRSSTKQRSLLLQPEVWIFGRAPSPESFETWTEDRPTADAVDEEGLGRFMVRNYFNMLTVS
ncbi:hypothetical protein LSCM1_01058 [Leishmania martiniquensis]|uniref:Uncharacterized protein n=1 Tax=Leishmania martiniquensis TaxID=1580590 RepID=A0A836KAX7_9TRYP|nr:hypothetical protein LSCM1_01058 [Leishmania martiniquensis]